MLRRSFFSSLLSLLPFGLFNSNKSQDWIHVSVKHKDNVITIYINGRVYISNKVEKEWLGVDIWYKNRDQVKEELQF